MRDRSRTIAALRALAERPGTPEEGETARRMLAIFGGKEWIPRPFNVSEWPAGTRLFYCYWCYDNDAGTVRTKPPKFIQGQWWMLIKFDRLKTARWVPVTSELGCHIATSPFSGDEQESLYRGDVDWKEWDIELAAKLGVSHPNFRMTVEPERESRTMNFIHSGMIVKSPKAVK